ncbi:putative metal-dependent hydrolase [Aulographum hederae CBS 113979]|uniref:Putative metal-dependent hydrolase n=1 Tax=Aulographum hederae CBS 113979 TaxID=1176131 RepID=A0A6G1GW55_9PEZI|nr:putative metal-dependent hydrolase [Aulographum hederae CBS 113979]
MIPLITLEEHFLTPSLSSTPLYSEQLKHLPSLSSQLADLGPLRLSSMNSNSISLQIISHGPAFPSPAQATEANAQLAAACAENPTRFKGFATLAMASPEAASAELRRCVRDLGFVGALVDNHTKEGKFYDGRAYRGFWATVQELDVPVYLHPTWPSEGMKEALYEGGELISEGAAKSMGTSGFGWHATTAVHFLRLFASGLFDEFPRLKIVLGHMGEILPFMLTRVCGLSVRWGSFERGLRRVWDENVWVTTSGMWCLDAMACVVRACKRGRVLYSVDYPFARNEDGLRWMMELRESGLVSEEEWEEIGYKNAEKLLGVRAVPLPESKE